MLPVPVRHALLWLPVSERLVAGQAVVLEQHLEVLQSAALLVPSSAQLLARTTATMIAGRDVGRTSTV